MREEYDGTPLRKADMNACPFSQFSDWLTEAHKAGVPDPNACSLCSVDEDSRPMARAVLLKGMDDEKFIFYTNYQSRKARQLLKNPHATMHFPWFSMERQVVVSGKVEKVDSAVSEEYFSSRPLMSKLGAWASRQSEELDSRETLERSFLEAKEKWGEDPPKPGHWGGYSLNPDSIEFWQGGPSRLHDRFIYQRDSPSEWIIQRHFP